MGIKKTIKKINILHSAVRLIVFITKKVGT